VVCAVVLRRTFTGIGASCDAGHSEDVEVARRNNVQRKQAFQRHEARSIKKAVIYETTSSTLARNCWLRTCFIDRRGSEAVIPRCPSVEYV
jgi:hypothetical protein